MKTAVYSGTRNLYQPMTTAAKSLLFNSSVEKIYFLIEDDEFPEKLPSQIETLNVGNQSFFPKHSANYKTPFSYMALLRVCYTKLFPDLDKILQLDVDTVVVDNIDELWEVDLTHKYFAAVEEYLSTYKPFGKKYYNIGVAMFNLDQIREDCMDDAMIKFLNQKTTPYIDQDACNKFLIQKSVDLPLRFNETVVTGFTDSPAIVHYAGFKEWQNNARVSRREYLKKYREMTWEEALNGTHSDSRSDI